MPLEEPRDRQIRRADDAQEDAEFALMLRLANAGSAIGLAERRQPKPSLLKGLPNLIVDMPGLVALRGCLKGNAGKLAGAIDEQLMVGRGENGGTSYLSKKYVMDKSPGSAGFLSYFADNGSAMLSKDLPSASMPNFSSAIAASSSSSAEMP